MQSTLPGFPYNFRKDGILKRKVRGREKILIPEQNGIQLLRKVHIEFGHIGFLKIYEILKNYYFFPRMYKYALKITAFYEVCLCNKTRRKTEVGTVGHFGPAERPFQIMSLDTVSGFGGRRSTNKYLHILVDHFTRFAYVLTSPNQNSSVFIKLISKALNDHHIDTLLTDQYGGLSSKEFLNFLKDQNIKHYFTVVDHPSSNGPNERLNQTLVNRIRCKLNETRGNSAWSRIA